MTVPRILVQVVRLGLIAGLTGLALAARSEAKEVAIPVFVKAEVRGNLITWVASVPNQSTLLPELNIGDNVTVLRVTDVVEVLARFEQKYRRLSHKTCRTSWFRKKCTEHWAHDKPGIDRQFALPSDKVPVTLEFVSLTDPSKSFRKGEFAVVNLFNQPIVMPGPLEMTVAAAVETDVPEKIPATGTPEGPVELKHVVGRDGPEPWFVLVVDFKTAAE
jgi:hypothetical protein